jgi:hypothetical protein
MDKKEYSRDEYTGNHDYDIGVFIGFFVKIIRKITKNPKEITDRDKVAYGETFGVIFCGIVILLLGLYYVMVFLSVLLSILGIKGIDLFFFMD